MNLPDRLYELPFDQFERYALAARVAAVQSAGRAGPLAVLDVGGYLAADDQSEFLPARAFIPGARVLVADTKPGRLAGYLRASGAALPFRPASFDLVVSCDTLEHVPPALREGFVAELARASRGLLMLAAPQDSAANRLAEEFFLGLIQRLFGVEHETMAEHRRLGLPEPAAVRGWLEAGRRRWFELAAGRLHPWLLLMTLKHWLRSLPGGRPLERKIDAIFNRELAAGDFGEPAYRRVFVIDCGAGPDLLDRVRRELADVPPPPPAAYEHLSLALQALDLESLARLRRSEDELAVLRPTYAAALRTVGQLEGALARGQAAYDDQHRGILAQQAEIDRLHREAGGAHGAAAEFQARTRGEIDELRAALAAIEADRAALRRERDALAAQWGRVTQSRLYRLLQTLKRR